MASILYDGLVTADPDHFDTWEHHDKEVQRLLGCPNDTKDRFSRCFPWHRLYVDDWCQSFVTAENASCGVYVSDRQAYISFLCAWPQNRGHGTNLLKRLAKALTKKGIQRAWFFVGRAEDTTRLQAFCHKAGFVPWTPRCQMPPWFVQERVASPFGPLEENTLFFIDCC